MGSEPESVDKFRNNNSFQVTINVLTTIICEKFVFVLTVYVDCLYCSCYVYVTMHILVAIVIKYERSLLLLLLFFKKNYYLSSHYEIFFGLFHREITG